MSATLCGTTKKNKQQISSFSLGSLSKMRILLLIAHVRGHENYDGCSGRSHKGAADSSAGSQGPESSSPAPSENLAWLYTPVNPALGGKTGNTVSSQLRERPRLKKTRQRAIAEGKCCPALASTRAHVCAHTCTWTYMSTHGGGED